MNQNNQLLYGLVGVLVGGILVWLLTINTASYNNQGIIQMMGLRTGNQNMMSNSNSIDAHFIEQMIPHHEDAITMARLAQTKAKRSEIKQLAKDIIDSQEKEISQMKDWYKEWFDTEVPTGTQVMNQHGMMGNNNGMHMGMMGDESDMTKLEQSSDFDNAFIEGMIPHHQMAVMMANMLNGGTNRPEMKRLADDIIVAQTKEINQMREWYKEWGY